MPVKVDCCVAAAYPSEGKRRRKMFQSELEVHMNEENEFERNPNQGDISIAKKLISIHSSTFKNNEPLEQCKCQDYNLKMLTCRKLTSLVFF